MTVDVHAAKTQPAERAGAGDEAAPFGLGSLRGRIWMAPDADVEWLETMREMADGPIFPATPDLH